MTIYLKKITSILKKSSDLYPFNIPSFKKSINIDIKSSVLIIVGENGTGKSTLLNAIANNCGFSSDGGSQNHTYGKQNKDLLSDNLRLSWLPKIKEGFFMRADKFGYFSDYIDKLEINNPGILNGYGGKSFHKQSHGEAFFSLFKNRFKKGIFLLDEPESALSPSKQIAFLALIQEMVNSQCQLIIVTHSPIMMSIPNAQVILLDDNGIKNIGYKETEHYQIFKLFFDNPDRFYKHFNK